MGLIGETFSRYMILLLSQFFVIFSLVSICFWKLLFTLNTTCFIRINYVGTLSSKDHILCFSKFPSVVMQVTKYTVGSGIKVSRIILRRKIVSVRFSWIDTLERTDERLKYCKSSGLFPSISSIPERLKHINSWDDEYTKLLHPPVNPVRLRH